MNRESQSTDWAALERLRGLFLKGSQTPGVYWRDENDLANYHDYFAARIGWKWDDALEEATKAGFALAAPRLLDWGCGSGIASLKALEHFGAETVEEVLLWDHSLLACRFAQQQIRDAFPEVKTTIIASPESGIDLSNTAILVSHALNELSQETQQQLSRQLAGAAQLLFVEAGDHRTSRLLIQQREVLRESFDVVAPCATCDACPMLTEENARHWCHFFARPPVEAFTEGDWARFASMMEIDLRSLPYSFLALNAKRRRSPRAIPPNASRLIGRPRQFKGYTRLLSCDTCGLRDLELQKRDDKALWKSLKKGKDGSLYRWDETEGERIKSGNAIS